MALPSFSSSTTTFAISLFTLFLIGSSSAQLSENFYANKCPKVFYAVKSVVQSAVAKEPRMGASLLRLFFHDCFVNGCDGSVLLDGPSSEKTAPPNANSLRGYEVIDAIKSKVEAVCPGIVSCADIVAIAARDSVNILGGPFWKVKLGRRDSKTGFFQLASGALPSPASSLDTLISTFKDLGLSAKDMVALSGAHTIGKARCAVYGSRIYNEKNIESLFAKARQKNCPRNSNGTAKDNNVAPLEFKTPNHFDNNYYKNLINKKGLLHSDQVLFDGGSTDSLVRAYSNDQRAFESDFVTAMIKMGNIKPLTGSNGQIRRLCGRPN
ncbi:hypothetical protein VNO80_05578 [Phaseolus coccineus]|uniref:Peroxidase n=1 Tax=Phaseolus coccineus TaxID=3886 RepID=A0AAN9NGH9_PHACN